jgi:hypothetical protein
MRIGISRLLKKAAQKTSITLRHEQFATNAKGPD